MDRSILLVGSIVILLMHAPKIHAQLSPEEFKTFNQLLTEPDDKANLEKRLNLIAAGIEREADPKRRLPNSIPVDLKRARIPAADGVPFLLERLEQPHESVKRSALRMLGAYGEEARAANPAVLKHLKENAAARADAIAALSRIQPGSAVNAATIL